jgi:hypothetical protein
MRLEEEFKPEIMNSSLEGSALCFTMLKHFLTLQL